MARVYHQIYTPYQIIREIGSGAFGTVFLVREISGKNRNFALKRVTCLNNAELDNAMREIGFLVRMEHANIVNMLEFSVHQEFEHEAIFSLLLEFCANGDLDHCFRRRSSRLTNIRWMSEISSAITYLHENGIIHQDLKPSNILLTETDHIKLADFGLAVCFSRRDDFSSAEAYYIHCGVGAMAYVAPEMFEDSHTSKVDIFGMGIIFHAILERAYRDFGPDRCYGAFVDGMPLGQAMFNEKREIAVPFRRQRKRLIEKMLKYNHRDRPTAREVHQVVTSRFQRWRQLNIIQF